MPAERALREHLAFLYGPGEAERVWPRLTALLTDFAARHPQLGARRGERLSERDAVLITYGDQLRAAGEAPLRTLRRFLSTHLRGLVSAVHLLPFYPYSSDDGFSVKDYLSVDPALGDWPDVAAFAPDFKLMFDAVINHVSAESRWFQGFLRGEAPYADYFITADPAADLSAVVRPRTSPLLTPFATPSGVKHVWTTFSADQIDLDYANPEVLLAVLRVLLAYVARGAELLRLDAVTYLWKEVGTRSVHHPKTHRLIKLFRSVLDEVAPQVALITETNVPHHENVGYFGDGHDEAQLVYNFALPPLVLHSLAKADARALGAWARTLETPSAQTSFFNVLASHDGVGLRAVEEILTPAEVAELVARTQAHGGLVGYRRDASGGESVYELNVNYYDALSDPASSEPQTLQVARFLSAQAIMLALAGVPGIYAHSLFGSRGDPEGVRRTGVKRAINREKLEREQLERELADPAHRRNQVWTGYLALLSARRREAAFHPRSPQRVLELGPAVFAVERLGPGGTERVICLQSVSAEAQTVQLSGGERRDLLTGEAVAGGALQLEPYAVRWLKG